MSDEQVRDYENKLVELRFKSDNLEFFIQKRRDGILEAKVDINKFQTEFDDTVKQQEHIEKLLWELIGGEIKDKIVDVVKGI